VTELCIMVVVGAIAVCGEFAGAAHAGALVGGGQSARQRCDAPICVRL
jgi:hypothetical protein